MKKILTSILLIFVSAGCGNSSGSNQNSSLSPNQTETPTANQLKCAQLKATASDLGHPLNEYEKGVFYAFYCK